MAYLNAFSLSRPNVKANRLKEVDADIFLNYRYMPLCIYCGGEYGTYTIQALENGAQKCKHCTEANVNDEREAFIKEGQVFLSLSSAVPIG